MVVRLVALLALACTAVAQEKPWWVVLPQGEDAIAVRADGKATKPAGRFAMRTPSPDGYDVEILVQQNKAQVRSISRVGYGDMGVNQARIKKLQQHYSKIIDQSVQ